MALPNGGGGYQIGDGNVNEINFEDYTSVTYTAAAAPLLVSDLVGGIIIYTAAGANNLQLPTVAALEAVVSSARPNVGFLFSVIATGAGTGTVTTNTGWTIVGSAAVATTVSGRFAAVKTGDGAWSLYRLS